MNTSIMEDAFTESITTITSSVSNVTVNATTASSMGKTQGIVTTMSDTMIDATSPVSNLTTAIVHTTVNVTLQDPGHGQYLHDLKMANRIMLTVILAVIMVSMGCVINIKDIKITCRRPVGVAVGFICQFIVMPLLSFALAHALQIRAEFAIGMLVIGCSPGGTVSNLFTYWTNGDVCLSVVMTTASVVFAFGMMPLNLFIYSRSWTDSKTIIPYKDIVVTLVAILVPVAIGIAIRYKLPRWTYYIEKLGSILGLLGILTSITLNGLINPKMFTSGWKVWFAAVTMPLLGFALGYIIARIMKQSHKKCRTIAFETGCQNVALTLTLILLTFSDHPQFGDLMTFPSLFGIFTMLDMLICVLILRGLSKFKEETVNEDAVYGKMRLEETTEP